MKRLKEAFWQNLAKWREIDTWNEKERSVTFSVDGLVLNLEQIELLPFVWALVPFALAYRIADPGPIDIFNVSLGQAYFFISFGSLVMLYAIIGLLIRKLITENFQRKWIAEFYADLEADCETAEAFEKLKKLDPVSSRRLEEIRERLSE